MQTDSCRMIKNIIDGVDVSGYKHFENAYKEKCCELTCCGGCRCIDYCYKQLKRAEQKLEKIKKVCNKFTPDNYKILLIINDGIVDE